MVSCCFIQSVLAIWITLAFGVCLFQELDQSCWGVRDSRRDVNALLDDFKNSHEHFFKCLAGSWGVVLRCLTNEYKSLYISLKTVSVLCYFNFIGFFVGWIVVTKDGHSLWWRGIRLETDGSKTESVFFSGTQGTYELHLLQRHSLPDPDFYV